MGSFFRTRQTLRRCGYAARAAFPQLRFVDSPSPGPQSVRFFAHPIDVTGFLSCSQRWLCFFESANHPAIPAAGVLREIHSCASICIRGRHFHFGGRTAASGGRAPLIAVSFCVEMWFALQTIRSFGRPIWVRFVKRASSLGQKPHLPDMKALQLQMASFFRARRTRRRCGHAARAAFPQSRFRFVDPRSVCIRVHPWPAFSSQTT
jgi:hypothetical protein